MPHSPLISTVVFGLVLAFFLGAIANRLRLSPLVGYLLAGVAIGPYTPGFVADQTLARDLAEIGIILLMFGIGLQFSLRELLTVKSIAVPGAALQILTTSAAGMGLAWLMGWPTESGIVLGLALSVASTVVVTRILDERRIVNSQSGQISVGWLIVEDFAMIFAILLLPTLAGITENGSISGHLLPVLTEVGFTVAKAAVFIAVMLLVGQRVIPWILHYIAHTGSRELFRLGVLTLALGVAYGAAELVGVSFALGAFLAGLVLSETQLSQRAAAEALPLRDAFAVLFFVSVGMLFDPSIFIRAPWQIAGVIFIITVIKPAAAFFAMRILRYPLDAALMVAASRTQIGEFSFILAGIGVGLGLLPAEGRDLILAGAMLSIIATPAFFLALDRAKPSGASPAEVPTRRISGEGVVKVETFAPTPVKFAGHTIVVGFGRVGSVICERLQLAGEKIVVIEEDRALADQLVEHNVDVIFGNAPAPDVMIAANLHTAKRMFLAIPDSFEAGQIVNQARSANENLQIIARAHSDAEAEHLRSNGADVAIVEERELAYAMLKQAPE
ncbi:Kef family K(+) transporter (plasmid) [Roseibium aggregatum]|uniref:YbaL family putative K(+) efflux transporter n=1 Tax=Roseibium aggregatum TaxID=187304 RepID=UPI001E5B610A|nr:YbaL family putative K(+) efflux transporter [Roseibium aggregatum]UES60068.1 Kef family K(+) transporter [Roseibium aggregatum]